MRLKFLKLGLLFGLLGLTGCASVANYRMATRSWIGQSYNDLISSPWAYPNSKEKLKNGNIVYIYDQRRKEFIPSITTPGETRIDSEGGSTVIRSTPSITTPGYVRRLRCTTWFEVNPRGIIVRTNFRGNSCAYTKGQRKAMSPPANPSVEAR
jgi:hypothetical protein